MPAAHVAHVGELNVVEKVPAAHTAHGDVALTVEPGAQGAALLKVHVRFSPELVGRKLPMPSKLTLHAQVTG